VVAVQAELVARWVLVGFAVNWPNVRKLFGRSAGIRPPSGPSRKHDSRRLPLSVEVFRPSKGMKAQLLPHRAATHVAVVADREKRGVSS
jgi:hypothetical protein